MGIVNEEIGGVGMHTPCLGRSHLTGNLLTRTEDEGVEIHTGDTLALGSAGK